MPKHNADLQLFQEKIGYSFKNMSLLANALTHSSYANEMKNSSVRDNERLEFLGDAVLELVSSEYLYNNEVNMREGDMTKLRASVVCEPTLAASAKVFELPEYIMLGKGEDLTGGRERASIVSDACEALIGAIYLDGGFANAKEFIYKYILNDLDNKKLFYDSKTTLQEFAQSRGKNLEYILLGESGPDHKKTFEVKVALDGMFDVTGKGQNKKAAQQDAAYKALLCLREKGIDINPKGNK